MQWIYFFSCDVFIYSSIRSWSSRGGWTYPQVFHRGPCLWNHAGLTGNQAQHFSESQHFQKKTTKCRPDREDELHSSFWGTSGISRLLGYRAMWQPLKQKHSFTLRRCDVMNRIREPDPSEIEYCSVWHVDGYDKLKPFGIAWSGRIDGFSTKMMWLTCGKSNNDPGVGAQNDIECVAEFWVFPMRLRTDFGRRWTDGSTSLFLKISAQRCFCRSQKSHVWHFSIWAVNWKLVVLLWQTKVFISYSFFTDYLLHITLLDLLYMTVLMKAMLAFTWCFFLCWINSVPA